MLTQTGTGEKGLMNRWQLRHVALIVAFLFLLSSTVVLVNPTSAGSSIGELPVSGTLLAQSTYAVSPFVSQRLTFVTDDQGRWLATFTEGAHTVTLAGPERVLRERTGG